VELVADDVVFAYNRLDKSPKEDLRHFDHLDKVEATDSIRLVFTSRTTRRVGFIASAGGYYSGIVPKEVARRRRRHWECQRHRPFMLGDFVQGNSNTYVKNPNYWGNEKINGRRDQTPLLDKVVYRTIKDEATVLTALRTGKLDILEYIRCRSRRTGKRARRNCNGRNGSR